MKFFRISVFACFCASTGLFGQDGPRSVEAGLEKAVKWKWRAVPSDPRDWGLPMPALPVAEPSAPAIPAPNLAAQTSVYEVKRGDAIILIARKFGITAEQLKLYNGLTSDLIHVGDQLKIPTRMEAERLAPTPVKPEPKSKKSSDSSVITREEMDAVVLQAFLDREQFSPGPINGKATPVFGRILYLYQTAHPGAEDVVALTAKAREVVGDGFATYVLKPEDFRFIAPPAASRAEAVAPAPTPSATPDKKSKPKVTAERAHVSYENLVKASMLAYNTPWEFVAERFHCDEAFLRKLNSHIKTVPTVGTEFRVPNVVPFAIEEAFSRPLQPKPDPQTPVTAKVLDLSVLQIFHNDALLAAMPLSIARPGLRGKGTWTVLQAIPRPRMATRQEERDARPRAMPLFGQPSAEPEVKGPVVLTQDQYLAAGPNNPVGILWIDLAKAENPEPLSYGLHGTSTPDQMNTLESLGGFRVTNWDILRAARMLPPGTPLEWVQSGAAAVAAPAALP